MSSRWADAAAGASGPFPAGATLRRGATAWIHSEDSSRLLGGALAWAGSAGATELHLLVESEWGILARRAAAFSVPPRVWKVSGRNLHEAEPDPLPLPAGPPEMPPDVAHVVGAVTAPDVEVVAEHGVLSVEVMGLEVARVEAGPEGARLAVGVGRHDREARRMVHAGMAGGPPDPAGELQRAVEQVRARRVAGAPAHPANQLATERWLRALVVRRPELVGAAGLTPVPPPLPRANLRARSVAPAVGRDADGAPLVVVFSTGVDPELVPTAADVRLATSGAPGPKPRLVLVVPERDDHPVTRRLAGMLVEPAEVRTVPSSWREIRP